MNGYTHDDMHAFDRDFAREQLAEAKKTLESRLKAVEETTAKIAAKVRKLAHALRYDED